MVNLFECWSMHLVVSSSLSLQKNDNVGEVHSLTCRPNSRCRSPCLGGGDGCPLQSRSGGTVPSWWKTFSSAKHSVSIICRTTRRDISETSSRTLRTADFLNPHLILPGDRDAACGHFAVERLVFGLKFNSFHCGELLDVQHVFAIDGLRLQQTHANTHGLLPPPPLKLNQE